MKDFSIYSHGTWDGGWVGNSGREMDDQIVSCKDHFVEV
jgi:hypothetical protein